MTITYRIGAVTDTGHVRTQNQDRYLIRSTHLGRNPAALLVVADGMGGLERGEVASEMTIEGLENWWNAYVSGIISADQYSVTLDDAIYEIHRKIYYYAQEHGMSTGSTLSALFLRGARYCYKQIGDSRIYLHDRKGNHQITRDQNVLNREVDAGHEIGNLDPRRGRALVNALGPTTELNISTASGSVKPGMAFLLCSDGFYGELGDAAMEDPNNWGNSNKPQEELDALLQRILSGPAGDNATAVLCRVSWAGLFSRDVQ